LNESGSIEEVIEFLKKHHVDCVTVNKIENSLRDEGEGVAFFNRSYSRSAHYDEVNSVLCTD
jgi:hypothetical protein